MPDATKPLVSLGDVSGVLIDDYYNNMSLKQPRRQRAIFGSEHSREAGRAAGRDAVRSRRVEGGKPAYQLA